ncbi:MAG: 2-(1,2-epoxy-1,2-dihydrophenyl)acetyl-CoA isomerase, partial [Chitinophagaceae bacterium]
MSSILFEIKDAVAFITLNRPDKYNAFNREMALLLQDKLDECKAAEVRCVMITGLGKAFCSGQDLEEVVDPNGPKIDAIVGEHYNPIITRIRQLQKPVIAAVNGVAAGAGANIALACDIVIAAKSSSFIQAFSKIGLIPDSGGTFFLPRLVGWQRASALMMLGDKVSAEEAERFGMI